eukprot:3173234-Rhodomonas_salina.1
MARRRYQAQATVTTDEPLNRLSGLRVPLAGSVPLARLALITPGSLSPTVTARRSRLLGARPQWPRAQRRVGGTDGLRVRVAQPAARPESSSDARLTVRPRTGSVAARRLRLGGSDAGSHRLAAPSRRLSVTRLADGGFEPDHDHD